MSKLKDTPKIDRPRERFLRKGPEALSKSDLLAIILGSGIKGNVSKNGYGKVYFLPGCADYQRVKIDFEKGDMYFCDEAEAFSAGFTKAESCK